MFCKENRKFKHEQNYKYFNNFNQRFIPKLPIKNQKGSYLNKI